MHIVVICQDSTPINSFHSSLHLCEVNAIIPSYRWENPCWQKRFKIQIQAHWVAHPDTAQSQIPARSRSVEVLDVSESGFLANVQLVPNRAKTIC